MRRLAWLAAVVLVVLGARTLAYALSPSPLAGDLSHRAGGPALPVVTVVAAGLALALASAVVFLASLSVRERLLLEPAPVRFESRLRPLRILAAAAALWLVAMPAFALLESYIHWRAGLGWHGLHCLVGPAHRDAIPLLGALSLVAAAVGAAVEHVLAWLRRTVASLVAAPFLERSAAPRAAQPVVRLVVAAAGAPLARGPPSRS